MNHEETHPEWCPLDHVTDTSDGSFGRALSVILTDDNLFDAPLVLMTLRDRTDSYEDPGVHRYVGLDQGLTIASYGYHSSDIVVLADHLLRVASFMLHSEETGCTDVPVRGSVLTWENAATLELLSPAPPRDTPLRHVYLPRRRRGTSAVHRESRRAVAWLRGLLRSA